LPCMVRAGALASTARALAFAMFVVSSCFHQPDAEELIAQRVVVTKFDPKIDFKSFATFAMPSSIPVFTAFDAGAPSQTVDPAMAKAIIDEVAALLSSRGYRRVEPNAQPDLGVGITGVNKLKFVLYGGWWGFGASAPGFWGTGGVVSSAYTYESTAWQS